MATAKEARDWAQQRCVESATASTRRSAVTTATTSTGTHTEHWCATASGSCGTRCCGAPAASREFWSLTLDERKRLLEVAIEEGRAANPDVVVQACTAAMSAKDCLELTRHAQQAGADIVYIQTPMMEAHGGEGVLKFFRYIADRTDIALGMFNSPSSGYVLTPAESARIYDEIPAVCATKEGRSGRRAAGCCTSSRPIW